MNLKQLKIHLGHIPADMCIYRQPRMNLKQLKILYKFFHLGHIPAGMCIPHMPPRMTRLQTRTILKYIGNELINVQPGEDEITFEQVQDFFDYCVEKRPDGEAYDFDDSVAVMTHEQAFSVIWYIQEHSDLCLLPDHYEFCELCHVLVDYWSEDIEYIETLHKRLCLSCMEAKLVYECACQDCENYDIPPEKPPQIAVLTETIDDLEPGLYIIKKYPFYVDYMIGGNLYPEAFKRLNHCGELHIDTNGYPMGFLCSKCAKPHLKTHADPAPKPQQISC